MLAVSVYLFFPLFSRKRISMAISAISGIMQRHEHGEKRVAMFDYLLYNTRCGERSLLCWQLNQLTLE
jgi:hypothetical protein